jgi:hypothetical protein
MGASCKLYLTYRSEYLVLRDLCVGVRERGSGTFWPLHSAACSHVLGPVGGSDQLPLPAAPPKVGERLCLYAVARRIVTGPIVAIEPAPPRLLSEADRYWQALFKARGPNDSIITLTPTER